MSIEPDRQQQQRRDLAETLRKLRKAAGLSGERLAARCAMSQAKISRIERGRSTPSVVDVERILKALNVPPEVANGLLELARVANVEYVSWRTYASIGMWKRQAQLKALAESSEMVRHFLPAIPSGLLQVPGYAELAVAPAIRSAPKRDVAKALRARLDRQAVLENTSRQFIFLMTEQAVRWQYATRTVMASQCLHMAKLAERSNVQISVIPLGRMISNGPLNIFTIYDDRLVLAELFSGGVAMRDPQDIAYHLDLFDDFLSFALHGDDATNFLRSIADEFMQGCD
ncbi:helix-turn-helix domain-containing protein [Kutzneria sp. NPDC052558]|uniref:helix-turn-helix domain-containing protein n=1 Tax=Kutzneria sp. NPDC052558 TaxID=3364121 RepID=UPI0037C91B09